MRSDEISASRVARVRQNPVTPFSVRWRVHDASLRGRRLVPRPPARHFQPEEMNNTSMDLVRVSVKQEMTREMTEDTKKIHNWSLHCLMVDPRRRGRRTRNKINTEAETRTMRGRSRRRRSESITRYAPDSSLCSSVFICGLDLLRVLHHLRGSPPPLRPHGRHGERMLPLRIVERA